MPLGVYMASAQWPWHLLSGPWGPMASAQWPLEVYGICSVAPGGLWHLLSGPWTSMASAQWPLEVYGICSMAPWRSMESA